MAMVPAIKPNKPFVAEVNGMFIGKWIYVSGRIHQNAERFRIRLQHGPDKRDVIALVVAPRFSEKVVVRNTRNNNGWGQEEREGGFPFEQGQLFGLKITCREDGYEIRANRYRTFAVYNHRLPFHAVTHVRVDRDCDIELVCSGIEGLDIAAQVIEKPHTGRFEIPFHNIREHSVVIVGKPTNANGRMDVNFKDSGGNTIHFHYNPRLNERQIVRNTLDGGWGPEERSLETPFPFVEGVPFLTKIVVKPSGFEVEINGSFAFFYKKRLRALKNIRIFEVEGDIDIEKITFY